MNVDGDPRRSSGGYHITKAAAQFLREPLFILQKSVLSLVSDLQELTASLSSHVLLTGVVGQKISQPLLDQTGDPLIPTTIVAPKEPPRAKHNHSCCQDSEEQEVRPHEVFEPEKCLHGRESTPGERFSATEPVLEPL